jgi:hypothetical protein
VKYNAHINVEVCASFTSVKYVYKYVYKGHDRASVSIQNNDEVQRFIDARYVSASEACWRLFSFSLHDEYPKHQRLSIHFKDEECVYFEETDIIEEVANRPKKYTTLTGWFELNEKEASARGLLYTQLPEQYVWVTTDMYWKPRERNFNSVIGRIYAISPRETEKYYLRMLLYHVRGATNTKILRPSMVWNIIHLGMPPVQ